jgi:uncharacterized glyoxalase superfamily protein PhnB
MAIPGETMKPIPSSPVQFKGVVPQFTVLDVIRTAEYYRDVFGFEIVGYFDGESVTLAPTTPPVFGIVRRDEVEVFFSRAGQQDVRTGRADGAYDVYFRLSGIDAFADNLRARSAEIIDGPEDRFYGQREVIVGDCNGLVLCFAEEINKNAQD